MHYTMRRNRLSVSLLPTPGGTGSAYCMARSRDRGYADILCLLDTHREPMPETINLNTRSKLIQQ